MKRLECTIWVSNHIESENINSSLIAICFIQFWQGSAADVAMCAMLEIVKNARLKELGWQLLLQVMSMIFFFCPWGIVIGVLNNIKQREASLQFDHNLSLVYHHIFAKKGNFLKWSCLQIAKTSFLLYNAYRTWWTPFGYISLCSKILLVSCLDACKSKSSAQLYLVL